jgi:protoheme ferro-lyase
MKNSYWWGFLLVTLFSCLSCSESDHALSLKLNPHQSQMTVTRPDSQIQTELTTEMTLPQLTVLNTLYTNELLFSYQLASFRNLQEQTRRNNQFWLSIFRWTIGCVTVITIVISGLYLVIVEERKKS